MTKYEDRKQVVALRDVMEDDLPIHFENQTDPDANFMAAFTPEDPADRAAFMERWVKIMGDDTIIAKTITVDGEVAGNIVGFEHFGEREVGYWIAKAYWDKGIATQALALFLEIHTIRPLFARAAKDNHGSLRVLEKCGFAIVGEDKGFANARGEETEEFLLELK